MSLLIKNGNIVTATESYIADIWCEGQTITKIGKDLRPGPQAEVIDASGKLIFPGFVDPHVHIHLRASGTLAKDTHESASRAALAGGTTTLIEMIATPRNEQPLDAFALWRNKADGHCACDYSFHIGVNRFDEAIESQLRQIVRAGITSFKVLLAYKGTFGIEDDELYQTLRLAKELGVVVAAHCENATLVEQRQRELLAAGKTGPEHHHDSRPPIVEAEGVHHLLTFAALHNTPVYIVHTSCEDALQEALRFRQRGSKVWIEALIQHLLLDKSCAERPDFESAKYIMSPPLREVRHQAALWDALANGAIDVVASDHAPFDFKGQKELGRGDFTKIPNGLPTIEDRINLLYTYGVKRGRISPQRFVEAASTAPARIFGLLPRKGTIAVGSDADLVVYDPTYHGTISAAAQHMAVDYNPFEGMAIEGRPQVVTVRGQVVVRDGRFVGEAQRGRFVSRQPISFD